MADRYWHMVYLTERYLRVTYQGMCISKNEHPLVKIARWNSIVRDPDPNECHVLLSWRELTPDEVQEMRAGAGLLKVTPETAHEAYDRMVTASSQ